MLDNFVLFVTILSLILFAIATGYKYWAKHRNNVLKQEFDNAAKLSLIERTRARNAEERRKLFGDDS